MVEWTDNAIVLANRPQGENHSVGILFTEEHGATGGLVYGGQGRGKSPLMQAGNGVRAVWKAKGENALGHFDLELVEARAAHAMQDRMALMALHLVTDILYAVLPEGAAYPPLYKATCALLDHLDEQTIWPILLVQWELGVLEALGYGLTLDRCVATGRLLEDGASLAFVSPKSGGAVSVEAGMPYKDKLLPLPAFMTGLGDPTLPDVKAALRTTGYFLGEKLLGAAGKELPESRERYINRLRADV
ncbi:DNA repair protein RecO [Parvularcula sp. LCG005]|uniref:DNA repair protein RecO n=1 Tax=Parvularcula sp. LCG005 TaxID=3078805 RepID=UPI0029426E71|nr:DNA repair protein RecO [Parvularcula sp. LCG005]WOI54260.1 DNA repair protein RecO [Parvularcula sp. LCG005]